MDKIPLYVSLGGEEKNQIKVEDFRQGETEPNETRMPKQNIQLMPGICEQRCGPKGQEEVERENEHNDVQEGHITAASSMEKMPLFSTDDKRYHYTSELAVMPTTEDHNVCPTLDENNQHKCCLEKHQDIHTSEKLYKLFEHRKGFYQRNNWTGHQNSCTEEKPYECPKCGKSFSNRTALKGHQGTHIEGRPYECAQCGKCFRHRQTLKKHQKIHTGEKLHECPACGKSFTCRGELTRHQRIHTGERPYKCTQCGKCFGQRVHLMYHQKTHTGEKPFKCPECGRNFSRKNLLSKHQATHRTESL